MFLPAPFVSNIAGTTRDAIEDEMNIDGYKFRFIDTAGIRETSDTIENLGINKTLDKAENSNITLYVLDANTDISNQLIELDKLENKIKIESPLIVTISTSGNICASRLLIDIGNQVEAEIITVVEGDAKWTGILREGNYGSNAIINDVVTQITGNRLVRCDALSLGRDAQVKAGTVNASSSQAKIDIRHWLNEPGSSLKVNGSILSSNENHLDSHIEITHTGRQTYSRLEWHSACGGKSNTTGTGMLRIDAGAKGADAGQLFHNLLLSEKAKANSIPELEVLESEVVGCGHGTANGPIDEQQLFYLSTRGFNAEQARAALIAAFLNTPLSDMGSDHLHGWLIKRIEKHLNLI